MSKQSWRMQGYHQHSASPVRTAFRPVTPSDAHAQGKLQQQLPQPHQQPVSQQQQLSQLQHPQQQQQQLLPQQQQHFPSQQCSQQSAPESDYMQHRAQQPPAASPTAEPATAGASSAFTPDSEAGDSAWTQDKVPHVSSCAQCCLVAEAAGRQVHKALDELLHKDTDTASQIM